MEVTVLNLTFVHTNLYEEQTDFVTSPGYPGFHALLLKQSSGRNESEYKENTNFSIPTLYRCQTERN